MFYDFEMKPRIILILLTLTFSSLSNGQNIFLDSLEQFVEQKYYRDLDDKRSLISTNYKHEHYGLRSIIAFVDSEEICNSFNDINKNCKRLSLFNQTHLNYCEGIEKFEEIEYLNISYVQTEEWGNYIREIPLGTYELENLKILVADETNLQGISYKIRNLKNLEYLSMSNGKIRELPKEIGQLSNLTALDLSNNQIELLPDQIANLINLKYLNLEGNPLRYSIAKILKELKNLEFLSITLSEHYYGLEETLSTLSELPNLKILHIRYSHLEILPRAFESFKGLTQLSLRGNWNLNLTQSFEVLGQIKTLKILDLSFTRITSLPEEVHYLKNINTLLSWKLGGLLPNN